MTNISGKKEAQLRAENICAFRRELELLEREGILSLSGEDRTRIDSHHQAILADLASSFDIDISDSQKRMSLVMRIVSTLGGIALCTAIFLFFFRYWGWLSTPVQVAVIIIVPLLALLATHAASKKEKTSYFTSLLAIIAFASFVMNLNVLGSIFNLAPSAAAFLIWGLFALCFAYGFRLKLQLAAALVCLAIYFAALLIRFSGGSWQGIMDRPETLLTGGLLILVSSGVVSDQHHPDFPQIFRLIGLSFAFLALLVLANEGQMTFLPWSKRTVQGIYQLAGFAAAIASVWYGVRKRYMDSVNLGAGFFAVYTFNRLFVWWWDWLPNYVFFLVIGGIALGLLAVFRKIRMRSFSSEAA
jgi:hypothetical protein